jgi:hypothetical protein
LVLPSTGWDFLLWALCGEGICETKPIFLRTVRTRLVLTKEVATGRVRDGSDVMRADAGGVRKRDGLVTETRQERATRMFEKKYTLLHSQKKRVHDILREVGLEPAEFSWSNVEIVERLLVSRLSFRGGEQYYFQFSSYEVNAWCVACPGRFRTMDHSYPKNWEEQEGIFRAWARTLKTELDTPDPWAELAKYRLVLNGELPGEVVDDPISAAEAEQIGLALRRLAETVAQKLALGDEQAALVRGRLEYVADAARRQRSRAWVYTVLGAWTATAAALALTEAQAAALWQMLRCDLGAFVNLLLDRALTPPAPTPIIGIKSGPPEAHPEPARRLS